MTDNNYQPPKVWTWNKGNGGRWGGTNRPTSGSTHEKILPRGKHPIQLYSLGTPNGQKVTILLEELLLLGVDEAEYDAFLIDIGEGDQFGSGFVEINPNSKIPALIDYSSPLSTPQKVFESGSILLYLAEKFDLFLPASNRTEVLNWLFWQMGSAPYVGGGFGHFYSYAPEKFEYAIDRFTMEVKRQLHVLEQQLDRCEYIAGADYTIADIAIWPWYGGLVLGINYDAGDFLSVHEYPNLIRWAEQLAAREGVERGRIVNKTWGDLRLEERHSSADIDAVLSSTKVR